MKRTPLYNSFESGELGYNVDANVDKNHYHTGCRTMINALPTPMGQAIRTPGTYFVGETTGEPTPSVIPTECLWAWFKHNEGSGLAIVDHSPVALNGELETGFGDPTTKFWSVPGFGHNDHAVPTTWVKRVGAARNIDYATIIAFVRPQGSVNMAFRGAAQLGEGGERNWFRIGWRTSPSYNWALLGRNRSIVYSTTTFSLNTWYCVWAYVSASSLGNVAKMYVRSSGGSFVLVIDEVADANLIGGTQNGVYAFGSNNGNAHMDGGDMLYYACDNTNAILTMDQANDIYKSLKSRHGML